MKQSVLLIGATGIHLESFAEVTPRASHMRLPSEPPFGISSHGVYHPAIKVSSMTDCETIAARRSLQ